MTISQVRGMYGIHDVRFFDRATWDSIAYYRVLGDVTPDFAAEFSELKGGSQLFPWSSHISSFNSSVAIVAREITADIIAANLDAAITEYSASATGDIISEINKKGTSVYDTTEGIATVTVKSGSDDELKEGWYQIKATAAATIDVYSLSSQNFAKGTNEDYIDDDGKITSTPLTVPASGGTVDVDNFGLTITGGSSTAIALTADDTMIFYVQKPHGGAYSSIIGATPMDFAEVGCLISSEDESGSSQNLLLYRVKTAGMSLPFAEKGYGEFNVNMSVLYDITENAIGLLSRTTPE